MTVQHNEEDRMRSAALQNAQSILSARQRAEEELIQTKEALEQKNAELANSLAMMRATLEATMDGMLVTDDAGRVTAFNQRYAEMWQVPMDVMNSGDHRRMVEACSKAIESPQAYLAGIEKIYELAPRESNDLLDLRDGRKVQRVTRMQVVDGKKAGRVWSFRDVTEHVRTEEIRARLSAIVQSSDDAIISKSLDGIIITWNEGAERIFGYKAEEVIGKSVTLLIPAEHADEEPGILQRLRRGERIEHYETVRVRKNGSRINVSLSVSPIRDSAGRVIGASKIARDISSQQILNNALREESRILETLNKTGISIASHLDLKDLVQSVTDAATVLSGAKFGAFFYNVTNDNGESYLLYALSGAPRAAFENFGLPRNTPLFNATFRGEGTVRSADITKDPRYGTMAPHHGMPAGHLPVRSYLAVPVRSRSGDVIGGLFFGHAEAGVFTERSERLVSGVAAQAAVAIDNARLYDNARKAAKERSGLLEAERAARGEAERVSLMKDEFLATLSHELRTPLNAILGWAQLLQSREGLDADLQEGLTVIRRNSRVQSQLIEDLLDMSRILSGKVRLDVQQVDLQDVLDAAVASVRHSAEAKDISLQVKIDPSPAKVRGDPSRLQQCLWNLLSNAIKFTPKGGKVQVSVARIESHLEIVVSDDGQGIKPEFLPHVFERFRQADASTTRRHGGLGLGLSIVKHLVELHGGSVSVQSAGEGQGATFTMQLPVIAVHSAGGLMGLQAVRSPPPQPGYSSLEGVSVLVVDDELDATRLLSRVLEECGARVYVATSAADGLKILQRERPGMILCDIGMPGQDGYEFIRQVRQLKPEQGGKTPAAALTAFARAEDRMRALRAGYQVHVAKPVEPVELTAIVASLAARR